MAIMDPRHGRFEIEADKMPAERYWVDRAAAIQPSIENLAAIVASDLLDQRTSIPVQKPIMEANAKPYRP